MRTRLLATTAVLLALAGGCADESVPTTDPGHTVAPGPDPSTSRTPAPAPAAAGRAFRAFARGGEPPAMAGEVQLYLGNALTGVVTERDAADPTAWATCTEVGGYAGRSCPLSPLTFARHPAAGLGATPQRHCLTTYGPLPPDLRELTRTSIAPRPGSVDGCGRSFAVLLLTDDDGRLVAVSTLLGGA